VDAKRIAPVAAATLIVLAVAGCGGGSSAPVARAPKPPPATSRKSTAPAPACGSGDVVVSHSGLGNGALSTDYTGFTLTNISAHRCSLAGFPKLFELGTDGRPVGGAAKHRTLGSEPGRRIALARGGTAAFKASWSADVYSRGQCRPRTIARFRVLLPGAGPAQTVPYPVFHRCTGPRGRRSFAVYPIEPSHRERFGIVDPHGRAALPSEGLPRCREGELEAWIGPDHSGGAGLGTDYSRIDVINLTSHACEIAGRVRLVSVDLHGRPVGAPARYGDGTAGLPKIRVARIGPHRSGVLRYATSGYWNYGPHGCAREYAAGYDLTLPGSAHAQYVPWPNQRCLRVAHQLSAASVE
jgi:hypothetical protein